MKDKPDNYYDLAIVDPPYGIGASDNKRGNTQLGNAKAVSKDYGKKEWDSYTPNKEYFTELMRVSENQIIWGGNYFIEHLHNTPCFIVWDKDNGNNGYADSELAWASFKSAVRNFKYTWHGMIQENMKDKEKRIHPTQKPKELYKWLLLNYAKENDNILDTHGGSMSIALACHDLHFDLDLCELDPEYFEKGKARLKEHTDQLRMI